MDFSRTTFWLIYGSIALVAFFLVLGALFPRRIARTQAMVDAMPGRSFAVGLINLIFAAAVVIALIALLQWTHVQIFGVPLVAVLALGLIGLAFGLAGLVELIGVRLLPDRPAPWRTTAATLALAWACTVPVVGWFGLLPLAGAWGLGAFILTFFDQSPGPQ